MKYKLHKTEGNLIFYHYFPQGSEDLGTVSINKKTGETAVVKPAEDDFGNRFAFKLIKRLKEFYHEKDFKDSGTIAWY